MYRFYPTLPRYCPYGCHCASAVLGEPADIAASSSIILYFHGGQCVRCGVGGRCGGLCPFLVCSHTQESLGSSRGHARRQRPVRHMTAQKESLNPAYNPLVSTHGSRPFVLNVFLSIVFLSRDIHARSTHK